MRNAALAVPLAVRLAAPLALALATAAPAQRTLVVDAAGGTGSHYRTIAPAIADAEPGDTVLVRAGTYRELLWIDEGIRLVGDGAELEANAFALADFSIHDLPAGQVFAMSGFRAAASSWSDMKIELSRCDGVVALTGLRQGGRRWALSVADCRQVVVSDGILIRANLQRSDLSFHGIAFDPVLFEGLGIDGGRVDCDRCSIRGGNGLVGGPGIGLRAGSLRISRSQISATNSGTSGNPAIETLGGTVELDPTADLQPSSGAPAVRGPATVAVREFATLGARSDGSRLEVELHGSAHAVFATLLTVDMHALDTPFGRWWIDADDWLSVQVGTVPGSRLVQHSIGHGPVPPGFTVAIQAALLGSHLEASTAAVVVFP